MNKKSKLFCKRKLPLILLTAGLLIPAGYSLTSSNTSIAQINSSTNNLALNNNPFDAIDKSNSVAFNQSTNHNASSNDEIDLVAYSSIEPFNVIKPNAYNFNQSISLFEKQTDFSLFEGRKDYLSYDIKNYGINLLRSKFHGFVIDEIFINNLSLNNKPLEANNSVKPTNNIVVFNKKNQVSRYSQETELDTVKYGQTVDFELNLSFQTNKTSSINFDKKSFVINPNKTYLLKLQATNQSLKPVINEFAGRYYLGWKLDKVQFLFNNEVWTQDLNITQNYFSNTFKYQIDQIDNKASYFDLLNLNQTKLDAYLENDFKKQLANNFQSEFIKQFNLVADANKVVYDLLKDETTSVIDVFKNNFVTILNFLANSGIFNNFFVDSIIKAFEINTKSGLENLINQPFYDLVKSKKDKILSSIGINNNSVINTLLRSYEQLFNGIDENFDLSFIFGPLKDLLKDQKLYSEVEIIIKNQLFGLNNTKQASLFELVFNNLNVIKKVVDKTVKNKTITSFINLLLTPKNEKYSNFYELLFKSEKEKNTDLFNLIFEALNLTKNQKVKDIVQALIIDNNKFTKKDFYNFAKNLVTFTNGFLERKENDKEQELDFYDSFKNLTFTHGFNSYSYNKQKHTLSYEYEIKFGLKNQIELTLFSDLKKLINLNAILKLLDLVLKNNPLKNKESTIKLTNLETLIKNLLPESIKFGPLKQDNESAKTSSYSFIYKTTDNQVWFKPVFNDLNSAYELGFDVGVEKEIRFEDHNAIESLTSQFENVAEQEFKLTAGFWIFQTEVATIKASLKTFYKALVQQLFLKPHSSYEKVLFTKPNETIATINEFDGNSFSGFSFDGIKLDQANKKAIENLLSKYKDKTNDSNFFKEVKSNNELDNKYKWKKGNEEEFGYLKPLVSSELKTKLDAIFKTKLDELQKQIDASNLTKYKYELNYNIKQVLTPSLKLNIQFVNSGFAASSLGDLKGKKIETGIKLHWYVLEVKVKLPFKVMDKNLNQLTDSYTFNISDFGTD